VSVRVEAATPDLWPEVRAAFGARAARNPDSCWCQRFRRHEAESNEAALHAEVQGAAVPVGLVAFRDDAPVGWTRVVPRGTLPGITGNTALARMLAPDPRAWWVACVTVRADARGVGVGTALREGAREHARRHGATVVDGHPVDLSRAASAPSPSALFTGTLAMFQDAGFAEIGRTHRTRPVMRAAFG
jgi:GNAT superfamily N-acetyltransferase